MWIEFKVDDRVAQEWFTYAGYKIRDARLPLGRVAFEVIRPGIEEQFATEGGRTGGWRPLSWDYADWKYEEVGDKPTLVLYGEGKRRLLALSAFHVHKESMRYNPDDPGYMHWHQTGGWKRGRPPARPIVRITEHDRVRIDLIFREWLQGLRTANQRRPSGGNYLGSMPGWSVMSDY